MSRAQIKALACALFHDGIDVDRLSCAAKDELRKAVKVLLAISSTECGPVENTKDRQP